MCYLVPLLLVERCYQRLQPMTAEIDRNEKTCSADKRPLLLIESIVVVLFGCFVFSRINLNTDLEAFVQWRLLYAEVANKLFIIYDGRR